MRISISLEPRAIHVNLVWQELCDDLNNNIDFINSCLQHCHDRKIVLSGTLPESNTSEFSELARLFANRKVSLSESLLLNDEASSAHIARCLPAGTTLVFEPYLFSPEKNKTITACLNALNAGIKVEFGVVPSADEFQLFTQDMPVGTEIELPSGISCKKVLSPNAPTSQHAFIIKQASSAANASGSSSTSLVSDDGQSIDMSVFQWSTVSPDVSMPHDVLLQMVQALNAEMTFWMPDGLTQDLAIAVAKALPRKITLMLPSDKTEQELAAIVAATIPMFDIEIFIPHTLTASQAVSVAAAVPRGNTVLFDLFLHANSPEAKQAKSGLIKLVAGAMQSGSRITFLKDEAQAPEDVATLLEDFIQALTQPDVILCIPDWVDLSFWHKQAEFSLSKPAHKNKHHASLLDELKVPCILELEPNDKRGEEMVEKLCFGSRVIITDNEAIEPSWLEKIAAAMPAGTIFHLPHATTIKVAQKATVKLPSSSLLGLNMTPATHKVYIAAIRYQQRKAACLVALAPELSEHQLSDIMAALNACDRLGDSVVLLPGTSETNMKYIIENLPSTTELRLATTVPPAEAAIFAEQLQRNPHINFRLTDDISDEVLRALVSSLTNVSLRLDFTLSREKMTQLLSYLAPDNTLVLSQATDETLALVIANNLNADINLWLPSGLRDAVLDILARCVTSRNRLLLSDDMTVAEVSRLARAVSSLDSLVLDGVSLPAQAAAQHIIEERRQIFEISATMMLEDSEVHAQIDQAVASGKPLRLLPRSDYLTVLRLLPKQTILSIPAQADAALLKALNTKDLPTFHLLFDCDMSESQIQAVCGALNFGTRIILPENMPLMSMQAVARNLPRQGSLGFKGQVSKATLCAVAGELKSLDRLVVPTTISQHLTDEDSLPQNWLKELISTIPRDKQIVIELPGGIDLPVLRALADAPMTANLRLLLSQKMSSEEVRLIAAACCQKPDRHLSDSASIEFPKDMRIGALVELSTTPGLSLILPAELSIGEVDKVVDGMRNGRLTPRASTNETMAALANHIDASCTIVVSARLSSEHAEIIAYSVRPGVALRVSSDLDPQRLISIARHLRPEAILEISSTVLPNASDIAANLHPGAILRVPNKTTPAQLAEIAATLAEYAILDMPPLTPRGADPADIDARISAWTSQTKQWVAKLKPKAIMTFSANLYQEMMSYCEQTVHISGASNQAALAGAKRVYAQEMVRSIFKDIIQSLPKDCGLLLPSELDKAELGHLVSYLPKSCVFWLSSTMSYEKIQHLATCITPPAYKLCVGQPEGDTYAQGTFYLQKRGPFGQKIDFVTQHDDSKIVRGHIDVPIRQSLETLLSRPGYREFILRELAIKQYIPMNSGIKLGCLSLTERDAFQLADVFGQRWDGDHSLIQRRLVEEWSIIRWPVTNPDLNNLQSPFKGIPLTWVASPVTEAPSASLPVKVRPLYSSGQTSLETRAVNPNKRGTRPVPGNGDRTHHARLKKQRGHHTESSRLTSRRDSPSSFASLTLFGAQYTSYPSSSSSSTAYEGPQHAYPPSQGVAPYQDHPPYDPLSLVTRSLGIWAPPYYPPSHGEPNPGDLRSSEYPEYSQHAEYFIGANFSEASTSSYYADPHPSDDQFNNEYPWVPQHGFPEPSGTISNSSSSHYPSSQLWRSSESFKNEEPQNPSAWDDRPRHY